MNISDSEIKKVALFFVFSLLDERMASELTLEAVGLISRKKVQNPSVDPEVLIVTTTLDLWKRNKCNKLRGRPNLSQDSGFIFKNNIDLGPWKEFQKAAQEEELLACTWNAILGIDENKLSQALGLTVGTVRYRVGRALRKLGALQPVTSGRNIAVVTND